MCSGSDLFLCLLAVLFPPIAVWIKRGICTADSAINLALCCLGYLPGLIHAWYIVSRNPEPDYSALPQADDSVTVWHVYAPDHGQPQRGAARSNPTYGTLRAPGGGQFPGQSGSGSVNYYAQQPKQKVAASAPAPGGAQQGEASGGGEHGAPPPTYAEVVQADHKVQTQD